jgi:hypothetical protein
MVKIDKKTIREAEGSAELAEEKADPDSLEEKLRENAELAEEIVKKHTAGEIIDADKLKIARSTINQYKRYRAVKNRARKLIKAKKAAEFAEDKAKEFAEEKAAE